MTQMIQEPGQVPATTNGNGAIARPQKHSVRGGIVLESFEDVWRMSLAISKSGLAPKGIQTPEAIFTAIQLGLELGLSPMSALQSIGVINGRPSIYGDAALALVRGSGLSEFYTEFPSNNAIHALAELLAVALEYGEVDEVKKIRRQIAELGIKMDRNADDFGYTSISKRVGGINAVIRRFTIADAKRAKLFGKAGPWQDYAERMLMWRSRGFNLRDNFGDVLRGMYTAEEAGDMGGNEQPPSTVTSSPPMSRTQALLEKVSQRPVSEGQTFEPTEEAIAAQQAPESPEKDVAGADAKPAAEARTFADFAEFKQAMIDLAIERNIKPSEVEKIISGAVLSAGFKGKEAKIDPRQLAAWYGDFVGGVVQ